MQNTAKEVGVRVDEFGDTAERMIKNDHYDSRRIRHEVDETQKRLVVFFQFFPFFMHCFFILCTLRKIILLHNFAKN